MRLMLFQNRSEMSHPSYFFYQQHVVGIGNCYDVTVIIKESFLNINKIPVFMHEAGKHPWSVNAV
jgi:hypothetical protein